MWQTRQNSIQSFAFVISVCFAVCLAWGSASDSGKSRTAPGQCEIELDDHINPNTAPLQSLVRLPGLGVTRAGAIVAYRENLRDKQTSGPVFRDLNDLEKVKGIGPQTAQNAGQWLKFE